MSIDQTVVCDGCSQRLAAARTAAEARRDARDAMPAGRYGLAGGKDYCPDCWRTASERAGGQAVRG